MFASVFSFAQEDLLKDIDTIQTKTPMFPNPLLKHYKLLPGNLPNFLQRMNGILLWRTVLVM
jgi:hypothetical protein